MKHISYSPGGRPGLLRKAAAVAVMLLLATLVLMFSAVLLVVVLIVGVIAGIFLWWKTRAIRKQFRQMQGFPPRDADPQSGAFRGEVFEGEIIEGVAVRVDEPRQERRH